MKTKSVRIKILRRKAKEEGLNYNLMKIVSATAELETHPKRRKIRQCRGTPPRHEDIRQGDALFRRE
jgi:hypothetical protein